MESTSKTNSTKKSSGFLKTTTWGTLIAASALLAAWGFSGNFQSQAGFGPNKPIAKLSQVQPNATPIKNGSLSAPSTGNDRLSSSVSGVVSNPYYANSRSSVISGKGNGEQISSSRTNQESAHPSELKSQTLSTGSTDPQVLIAAKMAPDLQGLDPEKPVDVIVQFRKTPAKSALDEIGGTTKAEFPMMNAQLVTVKAGNLGDVASRSDVSYISPNRKVRGALDKVVTAVNADIAFSSGWDGTGIGVAVLDSGIGGVDDLKSDGNVNPSRVVYNQSFVNGSATAGDPFGHGTHVSGIIAGNAYDSQYGANYPGVYRGIAPEASIINLRVLDNTGAGTDSAVIAALQQAIALKNTYNIRVVNMSLSRGVYESYKLDPLCQAVESAWNAGLVVVVAAGNMGEYYDAGTSGYGTIGAPGNDPYVITVGASNTHSTGLQSSQTITSFSSKGPTAFDHFVKPDLVAPG